MQVPDRQQQHQPPQKPGTEIDTFLRRPVHLDKETQTEQAGEYDEELSENQIVNEPSEDLV